MQGASAKLIDPLEEVDKGPRHPFGGVRAEVLTAIFYILEGNENARKGLSFDANIRVSIAILK
ncbi:Uncharacterised protein [Chlamydia trachomatis]|nr:Uncharacterised protein [Chlamydia trachomatis]